MNLLKPGYVPDGWQPGDNVHVVQAEPGKPGAVVHAPNGLRAALLTDQAPGTIAMIRWRFEDTEEVGHWLAWWRSHRGLKVYRSVH